MFDTGNKKSLKKQNFYVKTLRCVGDGVHSGHFMTVHCIETVCSTFERVWDNIRSPTLINF